MEFSASSKSLQYRINDHLNLKKKRKRRGKGRWLHWEFTATETKNVRGKRGVSKNKNKNKSKILARCSLQTPERLEAERGHESELSDATGLLQHVLVLRARAERSMRMK
jgi:hypothetical protein